MLGRDRVVIVDSSTIFTSLYKYKRDTESTIDSDVYLIGIVNIVLHCYNDVDVRIFWFKCNVLQVFINIKRDTAAIIKDIYIVEIVILYSIIESSPTFPVFDQNQMRLVSLHLAYTLAILGGFGQS